VKTQARASERQVCRHRGTGHRRGSVIRVEIRGAIEPAAHPQMPNQPEHGHRVGIEGVTLGRTRDGEQLESEGLARADGRGLRQKVLVVAHGADVRAARVDEVLAVGTCRGSHGGRGREAGIGEFAEEIRL
jgi:hypothetical protein